MNNLIKKAMTSWLPLIMLSPLMPLIMAVAQDEGESILDRLERRLLEKERDALSFGESFNGSTKKPAQTKYKYKDKIIDEFSPSAQDLKKIDTAITELEAQVEYLANGVHTVKQKILQDAGINNFVSIVAQLANKETMAFRTLKVNIDGHTIYEQNASLGLWLPDHKLPLFQGPMQPGAHRLDFEATIVQKAEKILPLEKGTYHKVSETYKFDVPGGEIQKHWEIQIAKAIATSARTQAKFKAVK